MHTNRQEAIAQGLTRYNGVECAICGNTLRYTVNTGCVSCAKIRAKAYRRKVSDKILKARGLIRGPKPIERREDQ